jgi:hypothetical protein
VAVRIRNVQKHNKFTKTEGCIAFPLYSMEDLNQRRQDKSRYTSVGNDKSRIWKRNANIEFLSTFRIYLVLRSGGKSDKNCKSGRGETSLVISRALDSKDVIITVLRRHNYRSQQ